jgi:hypothetical protein
MKWSTLIVSFGCLAVFAAGLILSGCEASSAVQRVRITPDAARLSRSQSVTLTASGGYDYDWSLSDDTIGTLNTRFGPTVVYTSIHSPNVDSTNKPNSGVIQTITVVSTIEGQSQATTNSTPTQASATAIITHF